MHFEVIIIGTTREVSAVNFLSQNPHFWRSALAQYSQRDFIALVERHQIGAQFALPVIAPKPALVPQAWSSGWVGIDFNTILDTGFASVRPA